MKTRILILAVNLLIFNVFVNAQIKVFDGGKVSVGSTIEPVTGCGLQLSGNSAFTENTSSIESSAFIRGMNRYSTPTSPDYTWYNDLNTGIFHPVSNTLSFTANGVETMRLNSSSHVLIGTVDDWGGVEVAINAGNQAALASYVNHLSDYMYAQVAYVNRPLSKALAASYDGRERFKVYGNGDVWAYGYYSLSDLFLKENIKPITNALDKLMKLNGVEYNYVPDVLYDPNEATIIISADPPKTLIGLIAEDVEMTVPEVVKTLEDGYKGISYGNLVALLIEAIKEQEIHINNLETIISSCCLEHDSNQGNQPNSNQIKSTDDSIEKSRNNPGTNGMPILYQNIPNPFNEKTTIQYYIPESTVESSILILDMQGRLLKNYKSINKGLSSIVISAGELKPGMYMYTLIWNNKEIDTKKMILTE